MSFARYRLVKQVSGKRICTQEQKIVGSTFTNSPIKIVSAATNTHKRAEALFCGKFVFVSPSQGTAACRDVEGKRQPEYSTTNPNFVADINT
jgi:hypothetical protein